MKNREHSAVSQEKKLSRTAVPYAGMTNIVLFINNLTLPTFRHPILQARRGKNNYEKHYSWRGRMVARGMAGLGAGVVRTAGT